MDLWAGYLSGAAGIIIGNPLDIVKVRLQTGAPNLTVVSTEPSRSLFSWIRGAAAPVLTYGALNAILYSTYNRCLNLLEPNTSGKTDFPETTLVSIWTAGAIGGLATWLISTPTELVKCQAQLQTSMSSWRVARDVWQSRGLRGVYQGGGVTSIRDAVGYGFYFWSYEIAKRSLEYSENDKSATLKVLAAGGVAGVVTWVSIYPLDVVKTRMQSPQIVQTVAEQTPLIDRPRPSAWSIAKLAYRSEGCNVFFRGLGVCSVRAFIVNAVQWFIYERIMSLAK